MRSLVILFAGLFSFFYIDLRLFRNTRVGNHSSTLISTELADRKEKQKRKARKYKNKKYQKRKKYRLKSYSLKGTKAKDHRYSNQKTLRRMFRND